EQGSRRTPSGRAELLRLLWEMVYEFVECFAAPDPAPHLTPEKRADLLEGLGALRVVLPGHRPVHLAQRVLTRRRHSPGEEATTAGIRPGVVRGRSCCCSRSHLFVPNRVLFCLLR